MEVYLEYSQEELDRQYEQRSLVPDPSPYFKTWSDATRQAKATLQCIEDISYGDHRDARMDLYLPEQLNEKGELSPVLAFIHGGAWQRLSKEESGYMAEPFVKEGVALAVPDFSSAVDESLDIMVQQLRRAILFLYESGKNQMIDPNKIFLCGHSSGAHLAANIAVTDWSIFDAPPDLIKGVTLVSGPYDLEPVRLSARNDYLLLDENSAIQLTPQTHLKPGLPPAIFAWGGRELEEFQRQSAALADAWEIQGMDVKRLVFPDKNHFDMGCEHMSLDSTLAKATLDQIKGY